MKNCKDCYNTDKNCKVIEEIKCIGCPTYVNLQFVKSGNMGMVKDGYHTFNELYHHRMILFSIICNQNQESAWKSKLHHDGDMFDGYFIVGINTIDGQYTYHYPVDTWDNFKVNELEFAPEWDGHQPADIERLLNLLDNKKKVYIVYSSDGIGGIFETLKKANKFIDDNENSSSFKIDCCEIE